MIAYLRDGRTFKLKHHAAVLSYDMTIQSIYDEVSDFTIKGTEDSVQTGDFFFAGGFCGIVKGTDKDRDILNITCDDIGTLFSRSIPDIPGAIGGSVEGYIKAIIEQHYVNQSDIVYATPYIAVIAETSTTGDALPDIEDGTWSVKSYLSKARRLYNIHMSCSVVNGKLVMRIFRRDRRMHKVFLNLSDFEVLEESFAHGAIGKITTITEDTGGKKDWYLFRDGTITNTYAEKNRVDGTWEVVRISEAAKAAEEVQNRFKENSDSHLIEFASSRAYDFYDDLVIHTKGGRVLTSYITAIRRSDARSKTVYKSGELRVMFDEKYNIRFGGK